MNNVNFYLNLLIYSIDIVCQRINIINTLKLTKLKLETNFIFFPPKLKFLTSPIICSSFIYFSN